MTNICLSMIVKNEAPRIERCLSSVVSQIDSWAIQDTGSTDDTIERIVGFFDVYKISGMIGHGEFHNFSQARNEALDLALTFRNDFDYLLLVDADMELVGDLPKDMPAPAYQVVQRGGGLTYFNTRLVHRDLGARYVGPTHEYIDTGAVTPARIHPDVAWFRDHADGANRPGKVERDIALLEADLRERPDNARSWFYLGNSFRELNKLENAINAYERRIKLGGWDEEVFIAKLNLSRCLRSID